MTFLHSPSFRGKNRRRFGLSLLLGASALACLGLVPANATTLAGKSLSDLAKGSELIFEGQAVTSAAEALPNGQGARTCVNFKIAEIVAGTHPGSTIRLCFLGGVIGGQGFGVSGMNYPAVGEHGIYLVESTSQPLVNPLIGWDQGRFLVVKDAATGTLRMTTADHRRIVGLSPDAAKPTPADGGIVSPDAAAGGVVSDDQPSLAGAMSREDFISRLRSYREH
jgi:hypothetical protein